MIYCLWLRIYLLIEEALYEAAVLESENERPHLTGVETDANSCFPVRDSSPKKCSLLSTMLDKTIRGMEIIAELRQSLGILWPEKGVVKHEQYDQTKTLLDRAKLRAVGKNRAFRRGSNRLW